MCKLSYYFKFPINTILYPLMIKKENKNSIIGKNTRINSSFIL